MAEYIEREAAIKGIMNDAPEQVGYCREDAADYIRYMDAADVAPVVHGRWENGCVCSNCTTHCGPRNKAVSAYYRYCPFCGAKMDGGVGCETD